MYDGEYSEIFSLKDFKPDSLGYYVLENISKGGDGAYYLIFGAKYFLMDRLRPSGGNRFLSDEVIRVISGEINDDEESRYPDPSYFGFIDDGINKIEAWSELVEKNAKKEKRYMAEYLRRPIIMFYQSVTSIKRFELNQIDPPWAEGVEGPGIGGIIDIEFTRPTKEIDILNGYVDLGRRHLYKENNRLKKIRIDSEDPKFTTTAELEDVVKFHEVPLPKATTKVRITILEVYKGTKYDDTCITKIFIPQQYIRPRAEYEAEIEKALKAVGYLK